MTSGFQIAARAGATSASRLEGCGLFHQSSHSSFSNFFLRKNILENAAPAFYNFGHENRNTRRYAFKL
jgi:hypothetical protein